MEFTAGYKKIAQPIVYSKAGLIQGKLLAHFV